MTFDIAKLGGIDRFTVEGDTALKQQAHVKIECQPNGIDHMLILGGEPVRELKFQGRKPSVSHPREPLPDRQHNQYGPWGQAG